MVLQTKPYNSIGLTFKVIKKNDFYLAYSEGTPPKKKHFFFSVWSFRMKITTSVATWPMTKLSM